MIECTCCARAQVRKADGNVRELEVARPATGVPSPVDAALEDRGARRVGHITLSAFNARALSDVVAAVRRVSSSSVPCRPMHSADIGMSPFLCSWPGGLRQSGFLHATLEQDTQHAPRCWSE